MSQNNAIYKGFKVSAIVRRANDESADPDLPSFLATVAITQVGGVPIPLEEEHTERTPLGAINLAVAYARHVIDDMSTYVKQK